MKLANTTFAFNLVPTLVYVFFLILLLYLGNWQLGRAEEKRVFLLNQQQSSEKSVIDLNTQAFTENLRHRKAAVSGAYDSEHSFLIDNQIVKGQAGYFVMTPFKIQGTDQSVLVNRGWVRLNKDRRILPDVAMKMTVAIKQIDGRINHFPVVGIHLAGAEIPTDNWPSVVQVVDANILSKKLGYSLLPIQMELSDQADNGFLRDWKNSQVLIPPEKHIAYAVQWFGLAITLTILFIWFSKIKNERTT